MLKSDDADWNVTDAGYQAMGSQRLAPQASSAALRIRAGTKQATVLAMLQRPEGATIAQIMDATGWQAHTVRGTLAGAFKKKLGLTILSSKVGGGERVYCVAR